MLSVRRARRPTWLDEEQRKINKSSAGRVVAHTGPLPHVFNSIHNVHGKATKPFAASTAAPATTVQSHPSHSCAAAIHICILTNAQRRALNLTDSILQASLSLSYTKFKLTGSKQICWICYELYVHKLDSSKRSWHKNKRCAVGRRLVLQYIYESSFWRYYRYWLTRQLKCMAALVHHQILVSQPNS